MGQQNFQVVRRPKGRKGVIMQVVLGTPASKKPLDEFIARVKLDEIEIIAADGTALAYLVAAARPGDATYAKFEAVFQSHSDELHRRAANLTPGITTQELFSKLDALTNDTELPCGSR